MIRIFLWTFLGKHPHKIRFYPVNESEDTKNTSEKNNRINIINHEQVTMKNTELKKITSRSGSQ